MTCFHVELPCHEILLADGLAVESYLETGCRSAFSNAEPLQGIRARLQNRAETIAAPPRRQTRTKPA